MASTEKIKVVISAKDNTKGAFNSMGKSVGGLTKKIGVMAAVAVPALALALGKKAVTAAADFEKSMANVSTLVDTTTENMEDMGKAVLEISKKVPVATEDLTSALYDVRSAGISAADSMFVLEKSAQLGVAGLGTTSEAANLATSAINSFGFEGEELVTVFDQIQLTVKSGKTTIAELAQSFGLVSGVAATAGISFQELMAATAALTTTGLSASVAQTQLKASMIAIQAPTSAMAELTKSLGFESGETMLKELGLVESMNQIDIAADGNVEVLKKAYGSTEALGAAMSLTGEQGGAFSEIMDQAGNSTGLLDEATKKQNETYSAQVQLLKNELNVWMVKIGNVIIPKLLAAMKILSGFVTNSLGPAFSMIGKVLGGIAGTIGGLIGSMVKFISLVGDALRKIKELASAAGSRIKGFFGGARAEGGPVSGGKSYLVGEKGPEMFSPGSSGNIIPNNALGGGGGTNIVVNVSGTFMDDDSALKMGDKMVRALRQEMRI